MKLTDEAKIDFLEYYWSKYIGKSRFYNQKEETEDFFNYLYPIFQNALIIEWFDSVGLFIGVDSWRTCEEKPKTFFWQNVKDINQKSLIIETYETSLTTSKNKSRKEATNKAIEKANQIYNQEKHGKI